MQPATSTVSKTSRVLKPQTATTGSIIAAGPGGKLTYHVSAMRRASPTGYDVHP